MKKKMLLAICATLFLASCGSVSTPSSAPEPPKTSSVVAPSETVASVPASSSEEKPFSKEKSFEELTEEELLELVEFHNDQILLYEEILEKMSTRRKDYESAQANVSESIELEKMILRDVQDRLDELRE